MPLSEKADRRIRVLFVCVQNAVRSQIAEALLGQKRNNRFVVASAGTAPAKALHPLTVRALQRAGIDWSDRAPKDVNAVLRDHGWDLVITVCERNRELCPDVPDQPVIATWNIPDPARADGSEGERETAFARTLAMLARRIDLLCALPDDKLHRLALKASADALPGRSGPASVPRRSRSAPSSSG